MQIPYCKDQANSLAGLTYAGQLTPEEFMEVIGTFKDSPHYFIDPTSKYQFAN